MLCEVTQKLLTGLQKLHKIAAGFSKAACRMKIANKLTLCKMRL
jgi:hypothetical protein